MEVRQRLSSECEDASAVEELLHLPERHSSGGRTITDVIFHVLSPIKSQGSCASIQQHYNKKAWGRGEAEACKYSPQIFLWPARGPFS